MLQMISVWKMEKCHWNSSSLQTVLNKLSFLTKFKNTSEHKVLLNNVNKNVIKMHGSDEKLNFFS